MASISLFKITSISFVSERSFLKYWYSLFLILLLIPITYRSLFSTMPFTANPWIALHMSYLDYGFIKRGLTATLLDIFGLQNRAGIIFHTVASLAVFLYLFLLYCEKIAKASEEKQRWIIFLFLTLNPLTLFNVSWDAGRSDIFGLILFIASLKFANKNTCLSAFFCCLGILNHEIYALLWLPPLILMQLTTDNLHNRTSRLIPLLLFPSITVLMLLLYGKYEAGEKTLEALQQANIGQIDTGIWTRSTAENFNLCMNIYKNADFFRDYFISLAYAMSCTLILYAFTRHHDLRKKLIIFMPFLSVIPLSMLGLDVFRWLSLAFMTSIILTGEMASRETRINLKKGMLTLLIIIVCLGGIFGPIGVYDSFPLQKRLL